MAANVQSMCQYWKNFDLQELQRELDTTATELANRQDESEGSRKRLVEQSRDFKKNTPEDIRKVVAPLLKGFQVEVDSLSKRSKAAEAAFLSVYKKLIDLPDPVPALDHAQNIQKKVHKVQDLEIENKQLRETLEEYNHEFAEVKNQEVTIKQLKEKLKEHEERVEATAQTRAKEKERELQRSFAEKERQLQETQLAVAKKLGEAEHKITSLHSALESTQSELFEVKAKYDEVSTAKADEMELLMADMERVNERAASADRQAERLSHQLTLSSQSLSQQAEGDQAQHSSPSDQAMDILKRSTLEVELAAKEKEVSQLVEDVQRLQASLNKLRETTSVQIARLEEELASKNLALRTLEVRLGSQEDYEEVKRELRVLKSIEFANSHTEDRSEESKSLEVLLLEKNKTLQTDNTHLKVVNSGLTDNRGSSTTTTTTTTTTSSSTIITSYPQINPSSSSTHKFERSLSLLPSLPPSSSSSSSVLLTTLPGIADSLPSSTTSPSAHAVAHTAKVTVNKAEGRKSRSLNSPSPTTATTVGGTPTSSIKREAFSPVSSAPRAKPFPHSSADSLAGLTGPEVMNSASYKMPSTPSSGRHSPTSNSKLSPDIPTPSQTPLANNMHPQSPITGFQPHIDPRHFAPPMSPYYGFPSNPFHPAFLPLNMVKSEVNTSAGGLDTGSVSKTVRELLSIHNIGQRLFAKHVLGLSQGTVSELLSKPKSWDKLTEKGRESYRKMHAWATDDANIMALKAISPKKGTQPLAPNNSYKEKEDSVTEERIVSILNEAQAAMHMKKSLEQQQVANAVVSSIYHHELSKMGSGPPGITMMSPNLPPSSLTNGPHYPRENIRKSRDSESRHHSSSSTQDESSSSGQEMVTRIYRQELEKLKKAADAAGNIAATAMYAQELSRLSTPQINGGGMMVPTSLSPMSQQQQQQQQQQHPPHPPRPQLSSPREADSPQPLPVALDYRCTRPNGLSLKTEPPDSTSDDPSCQSNNNNNNNSCGAIDLSKSSSQASSTPGSSPVSDSGRHAGSAFFLVRPRVNGHDSGVSESPLTPTQQRQQGASGGPRYGSVPPAECLSPLQRMQNIANSLTSRPQMGMPNAKPLRAVLPPITQEEFDRYANMNTDDLVKKVKETLSQYSISQRLFGESVLGLSQGSVSDLLARPKPWHMLTQKGREPFIRMQIFLEDADSIPRLVASQYRIPPDKLMRSNSRGSSEPESPCELPAPNRSQGSCLPMQQQAPPPPPILPSHPPPPPPHVVTTAITPQPPLRSAISSPPPPLPPPPPPPPPSSAPPMSTPAFSSSSSSSSTFSSSSSSSTSVSSSSYSLASPVLAPPSPTPSHLRLSLPPPPPPPPPPPRQNLHSTTPLPPQQPPTPLSPHPNHPHHHPSPSALSSPTTPTPSTSRLGPPSGPPIPPPPGPPHGFHQLPEHFPSGLGDPSALQRVWGTFSYPASMLEVIAMTSEIDTLTLTSRVKDVLQFHNLGQKLFGETVLGLSQGSVSELLSKPKPWHMLSIKGREPFIKMHLWLGDPQNVEHLKLYQTQIKAHRRRKSSMDDRCFDSPTQPKRPRVFFTEDQKDSLRQAYAQDPYPNQSTIEALAKSLNVGVKTVINWFHNHRMRAKQQHHAGGVGGDVTVKSEPDESSNQSDMSSVSGDFNGSSAGGGQFFPGGITPGDLNQWMFPQFEPVTHLHKVPSMGDDNGEDNKENNSQLADDDEDDMDEPDGFDSGTEKTSNNNNTKENEEDDSDDGESESKKDPAETAGHEDDKDEEDKGEDVGSQENSAKDCSTDSRGMVPGGVASCSTSGCAGSSSNSVNRRKRSNPQRVYEGAQLDRTLGSEKSDYHSDEQGGANKAGTIQEHPRSGHFPDSSETTTHVFFGSNNVSSADQKVSSHRRNYSRGDTEVNGIDAITFGRDGASPSGGIDYDKAISASSGVNLSSFSKPDSDQSKFENNLAHRINKIEKIQNAIRSEVELWDDEEGGQNSSSIEKIQKHIETNSADEDWEF